MGRIRAGSQALRTFLNGASAGILAFLLPEGFGIVGPLTAEGVRPSWGWLGIAGVVGGGPTFLGTLVGSWFSSPVVFVGFLSLAGGAILYVVAEILNAGRRMSWETTLWGV